MTALLISGGLIVDGSGSPARRAEVLVRNGRIEAVGRVPVDVDAEVVDASGLVVSPGFIDIHTHYDAQVLWDRDLTPSTLHGVTTVIAGNCGFGLAPTAAHGRRTIAETLEQVEGIPADVIESAVHWSFESFPQYLDSVDSEPLRCNFAAYVGHTPLRLFVLGASAYERVADDDEITTMTTLAREAVEAGALGLATSRGRSHVGIGGKPVPSRHSNMVELRALFDAVADVSVLNQVNVGPGLEVDDLVELVDELGLAATFTPLVTGLRPHADLIAELDRVTSPERRLWPQMACRPIVMQVSLLDPYPFASVPGMKAVLDSLPTNRGAVYRALRRDPDWVGALNAAWSSRWHRVSIQETATAISHAGRPLDELARELDTTPAELLLDVSLADHLRTRFRVVLGNDDEVGIGELLRDDRPVLGLSDAGAHLDQLCDAGFATHLLGYWVRVRQAISLEHAVWRLTGQPAAMCGLTGRGELTPGAVADITVFDADTVTAGETQRRWDLPGGTSRLVTEPSGVTHVWVAGEAIVRDGVPVAGARPGVLLRPTA